MRKFLLATAAVIAIASPALADNPAMIQSVYHYPSDTKVSPNSCRDYAVNVYTKAKAHDISVQDNSIWAVMDYKDHSYTVSVWCEVLDEKPTSKSTVASVVVTASGVEYEGAVKSMDTVVDTWTGKNDPKPEVSAKKKKGHNI